MAPTDLSRVVVVYALMVLELYQLPHVTLAQCVQPLAGCTCQTATQVTCTQGSSVCPQSLSSSTALTYLSIYSNTACGSSLTREDFQNLTALQTLHLTDLADYQTIEDHAFADMPLLDLKVSGTSIQTLPNGSLSGLSQLDRLDLSGNALSSLWEGRFLEMGQLHRLLLKDNRLTALSDGTFAGLSSLVILDLTNNSIASLSPNCFRPLTSLRSLKLSYNLIPSLPDGFLTGLPMTSLILDHNRLTSIGPHAFSHSHLLAFKLTDNLLTQFPGQALRTVPGQIMALYLSNNRIAAVRSGEASGLRIRSLSLSGNPLKSVESGAFSGTAVSSSLDLQGTELTSLPGDVEQTWTASTRVLLGGLKGWRCDCESVWLARFLSGSGGSSDPECDVIGKGMADAVGDIENLCASTTTSTTTATTFTSPLSSAVFSTPSSASAASTTMVTPATSTPPSTVLTIPVTSSSLTVSTTDASPTTVTTASTTTVTTASTTTVTTASTTTVTTASTTTVTTASTTTVTTASTATVTTASTATVTTASTATGPTSPQVKSTGITPASSPLSHSPNPASSGAPVVTSGPVSVTSQTTLTPTPAQLTPTPPAATPPTVSAPQTTPGSPSTSTQQNLSNPSTPTSPTSATTSSQLTSSPSSSSTQATSNRPQTSSSQSTTPPQTNKPTPSQHSGNSNNSNDDGDETTKMGLIIGMAMGTSVALAAMLLAICVIHMNKTAILRAARLRSDNSATPSCHTPRDLEHNAQKRPEPDSDQRDDPDRDPQGPRAVQDADDAPHDLLYRSSQLNGVPPISGRPPPYPRPAWLPTRV